MFKYFYFLCAIALVLCPSRGVASANTEILWESNKDDIRDVQVIGNILDVQVTPKENQKREKNQNQTSDHSNLPHAMVTKTDGKYFFIAQNKTRCELFINESTDFTLEEQVKGPDENLYPAITLDSKYRILLKNEISANNLFDAIKEAVNETKKNVDGAQEIIYVNRYGKVVDNIFDPPDQIFDKEIHLLSIEELSPIIEGSTLIKSECFTEDDKPAFQINKQIPIRHDPDGPVMWMPIYVDENRNLLKKVVSYIDQHGNPIDPRDLPKDLRTLQPLPEGYIPINQSPSPAKSGFSASSVIPIVIIGVIIGLFTVHIIVNRDKKDRPQT